MSTEVPGAPEPSTALAAALAASTDPRTPLTLRRLHEDLECPICVQPFDRALITTCGHTFCTSCLTVWANNSYVNLTPIPMDQPVDMGPGQPAHDPLNDPAPPFRFTCPMCRTFTTQQPQPVIDRLVTDLYPNLYCQRMLARLQEREDASAAGNHNVETLVILLGNTVERTQDLPVVPGKVIWSLLFARTSDSSVISDVEVIEDVEYVRRAVTMSSSSGPTFFAPFVGVVGPEVMTMRYTLILKPGYRWMRGDAKDTALGPGTSISFDWPLQTHSAQAMVRVKVQKSGLGAELADCILRTHRALGQLNINM
ncbi:hypothetical protein ABW21_db0205985 [Orbilia brochopaga]|nr:hypothetical protein ABW21_db0205985 [Drechslerella brochopaga]